MANFHGVCSTAPVWQFVNLSIEGRYEDLDHCEWDSPPFELSDLGSAFAPCLRVASLAAFPFLRADKDLEVFLKTKLKFNGWRNGRDQMSKKWQPPQAIGVCHSHALPRAIRGILPLWFERKLGSTSIPVYPVGVPVAAILGWVAAKQATFPMRAIISSGTNQVAEFTAVRAWFESTTLRIQVDWTCELDRDDSPLHRHAKLARMAQSLPAESGAAAWQLTCFGNVPWVADSFKVFVTVASARGIRLDPESRVSEDLILARGAACYAACQQSQSLPDLEAYRLEYHEVSTRDIGMIGGNREQGHYWHTLFPAGQTLPAKSRELRIGDVCPATFHLFEYTVNGRPPHWGSVDDQFLQQIRWYGSGALSVPRDTCSKRLTVQIQPGVDPAAIPQIRGEVRCAN